MKESLLSWLHPEETAEAAPEVEEKAAPVSPVVAKAATVNAGPKPKVDVDEEFNKLFEKPAK